MTKKKISPSKAQQEWPIANVEWRKTRAGRLLSKLELALV